MGAGGGERREETTGLVPFTTKQDSTWTAKCPKNCARQLVGLWFNLYISSACSTPWLVPADVVVGSLFVLGGAAGRVSLLVEY